MIKETISAAEARRFYNRLGEAHDRGGRFERAAKAAGLAALDCQAGDWALNAGVGTGKEQRLLQQAVGADGRTCGIDLARTMLDITRRRVPQTLLCEGDIGRLPYAAASFDRLLCSYVLDLLPLAAIPAVLAEFRRVLREDGRLVLVSLTEGVDLPSKALVTLWKTAYRIHPLSCGGCRPLQLASLTRSAGFHTVERAVIVQLGVPSELIIATP